MPIDFAPPQSNVNYQITPAQYTDPLQTLAQMGQLRTQNLQQQTAQMELDQARRKMDSQKGVIRWLADMNKPEATQETQPAAPAAPSPAPSADTGTGGFTPISGYTPVTPPTPAPVTAAPTAQPQPQPSSDSGFLGRMARDAGKYGILPDDWFAIQNHYLDYKQKSATLTEAQKKIDSDNADAMAGAYRQLAQNKTADQGDLNAVNNGLIARGVPREWLMTALPAGHGDVTPQMMIQAHGNTQLKLGQMLENEQKQSSAAASQATVTKEGVLTDEAKQKVDAGEKAAVAQELQNADTDEAGTPTPAAAAAIQQRHPKVILPTTKAGIDRFIRSLVPGEKQPEYDIKQSQARAALAYANSDPKALEAEVDAMMPASDPMNAATKTLLRGAMSRGDIQAIPGILKDAYDQKAKVAYATNPAIRDAEVQKAVATEQATAPLKLNQQIAAAKALRQGDNPAVAGVAPAAVGQVQNQAIKLDEQYAKEKSAADAIGKVLDLVESGNKAAGTNLPLLGVGALNAINGIKRINSAEIHQYEQAGSLWDRIVGKVEKLTTGQPIPKDVLDDIRSLHQTLGQQSYQSYNDALNSLNGRTGAKFAPTLGPPNVRQAPAQRPPGVSAMAIEVPLKSGKTAWMNPDAAAKFKHDHPELVK